jgi:hypothetical protein
LLNDINDLPVNVHHPPCGPCVADGKAIRSLPLKLISGQY